VVEEAAQRRQRDRVLARDRYFLNGGTEAVYLNMNKPAGLQAIGAVRPGAQVDVLGPAAAAAGARRDTGRRRFSEEQFYGEAGEGGGSAAGEGGPAAGQLSGERVQLGALRSSAWRGSGGSRPYHLDCPGEHCSWPTARRCRRVPSHARDPALGRWTDAPAPPSRATRSAPSWTRSPLSWPAAGRPRLPRIAALAGFAVELLLETGGGPVSGVPSRSRRRAENIDLRAGRTAPIACNPAGLFMFRYTASVPR